MSKLNNDIEKIIRMGVLAPSGDNLQPWRFVVTKNKIDIFGSISMETHDILGKLHQALFITHGALIENMVISANHLGYSAKVSLFPTQGHILHTASIIIHPDPKISDLGLFKFIPIRATNRNRFRRTPLTKEQKIALENIPRELGYDADIAIIENQNVIRRLSQLVSTQIFLILSNKYLHREFFKTVRWTPHAIKSTRDGLDVMTLGLTFLNRLGSLLLTSSWPYLQIMNVFGAKFFIVRQEAFKQSCASAYCGIVLPSTTKNDNNNWIHAGRILERMWLVATREGLEVQPTFATHLLQIALNEVSSLFSESQQDLINKSAREIDCIFNLGKSERLVFMFRVGTAKQVSARSLRKDPDILFVS